MSNGNKNDRLACATRLKKANPDIDFKTAYPVPDDSTSRGSKRSSRRPKRAKRKRAHSLSEEEDDNDLQKTAPQVNGNSEANIATQASDDTLINDSTLVGDEPQADDLMEFIETPQSDDQTIGQVQQPAGAAEVDSQGQQVGYQATHQAEAAASPVNNPQQFQPQQYAEGQVYLQGQAPMEHANYPAQPDQSSVMQQGNFIGYQNPQPS